MRACAQLRKAAIFTVFVFLFCEILIHYIVLYQCSWPDAEPMKSKEPLKAMLFADTHLLGSKDGHWFDKLRREWQMERSFQTALTLFKPDVVFLLGDLFDEGLKCDDKEWEYYLSRFHKMFRHSDDTLFHVVFGNHDIGFHYESKSDRHLFERFSTAFHLPSVKLLDIKGNLFVLVNSIALEGDECSMCTEAMSQLESVAAKLACHKRNTQTKMLGTHQGEETEKRSEIECEVANDAPAPILIQHFPLYRSSEANCTGVDAPPVDERTIKNTQKKDVVSKEASKLLLDWLRPRLVLSGHTHHSCFMVHADGTPEFTVPSFSWRNRDNPSFVLALVSPTNYSLSKCFMPRETTVIVIYILALVLLVVSNAGLVLSYCRFQRKCRRFSAFCCDR